MRAHDGASSEAMPTRSKSQPQWSFSVCPCARVHAELCNGSDAAAKKGDGRADGGVVMGLVATGGNDGLVKIWSLPPMGADILSPTPTPTDVTAGDTNDTIAAGGISGGSVRARL